MSESSTIQRGYRVDVARALGVYVGTSPPPQVVGALNKAKPELDKAAESIGTEPIETIELQNLVKTADKATSTTHEMETALTDTDADNVLGTDNDPPLEAREIAGLRRAMTRVQDELVNNVAKLSELYRVIEKKERQLALERRKLTETDDEGLKRDIRSKIATLERELLDLRLERAARLEVIAANRETLRSQINRVRETIYRMLHEDKTLDERIRTLFREQGITIASILTAIGMAISTLVLALTGGGAAPTPPPAPSDKGGGWVKEWLKKHLRSLGRVLAKLAGKAAAALPGIIGSVVSWLLTLLGKTAGWLAGNLWAVVVAVGGLLLVAAREWLSKKPKSH